MLKRIDDKLRDVIDRLFKALSFQRRLPSVRLTRIVIMRVTEQDQPSPLAFMPFRIRVVRVQPLALPMPRKA